MRKITKAPRVKEIPVTEKRAALIARDLSQAQGEALRAAVHLGRAASTRICAEALRLRGWDSGYAGNCLNSRTISALERRGLLAVTRDGCEYEPTAWGVAVDAIVTAKENT